MKLAHRIKISVFEKPEDIVNDSEIHNKLMKAMNELSGIDLETAQLSIVITNAEGLEGKKIKILELDLEKENHTTTFLKHLKEKLGTENETLLSQRVSRLDENYNFFIRLDKEKLLDGKYFITDSGNCFHIKISIAAFPKNQKSAMKVIEGVFES